VEEELKAEQRAIRRMLMASDYERRLLTYEIHDGPVQQLVGALMLFQSPALQKVWQSPETEAAYREGMAALLHAQLELRSLTSSLRTPVLEAFGVVDAIEDVARQLRFAPGAPEIECRDDVRFKRLEPTLENSLFRIAQEAMTNACLHSKSEKVRVTLAQEGDQVTLEVRDWGSGFDQDTVQENRFGLEGIRERCRILGGELSIKSKPGEGTVVRAEFPVVEAASEGSGSA
jgi:signal transduction histidine kinase